MLTSVASTPANPSNSPYRGTQSHRRKTVTWIFSKFSIKLLTTKCLLHLLTTRCLLHLQATSIYTKEHIWWPHLNWWHRNLRWTFNVTTTPFHLFTPWINPHLSAQVSTILDHRFTVQSIEDDLLCGHKMDFDNLSSDDPKRWSTHLFKFFPRILRSPRIEGSLKPTRNQIVFDTILREGMMKMMILKDR